MKNIIYLQGEKYILGVDNALSIGYNMKGKHVITKSTINIGDNGDYYIVNGGISITLNVDDMNSLYLNTPSNRKLLKKIILDNENCN
jgi:hypothetical protein